MKLPYYFIPNQPEVTGFCLRIFGLIFPFDLCRESQLALSIKQKKRLKPAGHKTSPFKLIGYIIPIILPLLLTASHGGITLAPVMLNIKTGEKLTTLEIINTGKETVSYQLDVHEWDDKAIGKTGNKDTGWIISPKIITLDSGKSQLVRLAPRQLSQSPEETCKRLMLRQIKLNKSNSSVTFQTNMSLPIFIDSKEKTTEKPIAIATATNSLLIKNPNNHHISIGELRSGNKKHVIGNYILPNTQQSIAIPFEIQKGKSSLGYELNGRYETLEF